MGSLTNCCFSSIKGGHQLLQSSERWNVSKTSHFAWGHFVWNERERECISEVALIKQIKYTFINRLSQADTKQADSLNMPMRQIHTSCLHLHSYSIWCATTVIHKMVLKLLECRFSLSIAWGRLAQSFYTCFFLHKWAYDRLFHPKTLRAQAQSICFVL